MTEIMGTIVDLNWNHWKGKSEKILFWRNVIIWLKVIFPHSKNVFRRNRMNEQLKYLLSSHLFKRKHLNHFVRQLAQSRTESRTTMLSMIHSCPSPSPNASWIAVYWKRLINCFFRRVSDKAFSLSLSLRSPIFSDQPLARLTLFEYFIDPLRLQFFPSSSSRFVPEKFSTFFSCSSCHLCRAKLTTISQSDLKSVLFLFTWQPY